MPQVRTKHYKSQSSASRGAWRGNSTPQLSPLALPTMPDWNDPTTWRDVSKHNTTLKELTKATTEAGRKGESHLGLPAAENVIAVLQGHQQTLADVSFVAGKLVVYITAAHEERIREVEAIHDLSNSIKKLTKTTTQLAKRLEKLEKRNAKTGC
jgi:hypothetical protein